MASYISFDCNNVQPRSAFYFAVPSCPDSFSGTLHCLIDLRQPIPKRSRRRGHIVIFWMFTGVLKQALLAKISSISVSHLLNFNNCLWHVIFLLQDTRGITWQDWFFNPKANGTNRLPRGFKECFNLLCPLLAYPSQHSKLSLNINWGTE